MTLFKNHFENIEGKRENAGNQHFLLFPPYFLPFTKEVSIFLSHLFCHLQMLSIWTSLKFYRSVKSSDRPLPMNETSFQTCFCSGLLAQSAEGASKSFGLMGSHLLLILHIFNSPSVTSQLMVPKFTRLFHRKYSSEYNKNIIIECIISSFFLTIPFSFWCVFQERKYYLIGGLDKTYVHWHMVSLWLV